MSLARGDKLVNPRAIEGMLLLKGKYLFHQTCPDITSLPYGRKFVWRSWNSIFESFSHHSFCGIREGSEEVSGGLAVGAAVAHVDEVFLCQRRGAKVDLSTFVEDRDLIEYLDMCTSVNNDIQQVYCGETDIICWLRGLIHRDNGRSLGHVSRQPQSTSKL